MLLVPQCDISTASLGVLLPSVDSGRVNSMIGRVRKLAPNVGEELQRGVTLGLRVVPNPSGLQPLQPPREPAPDCPMVWDGREGPECA